MSRTLAACLALFCSLGALSQHAFAADKKHAAGGKQAASKPAVETTAAASSDQTSSAKLMVLSFNGPKKQTVQKRAIDALGHAGHEVVTQDETQPLNSDADYAALGKETGAKAIISGDISMTQRGWELKASVRSGADGTVVSDVDLKAGWLPGLLKQIDKGLVDAVQAGLAKIKASEEQVQEIELAEPKGPTPEEIAAAAKPKEEEPESTERPSPLEAGLYLGVVVRNWTPKDSLFGQVLGQKDAGMASARLGLGIYPVAFVSGGILSNIGLIGSLETSVAAKTRNATGSTSNMYHHDYWVALHYRVPVGEHYVGLSGGLGWQSMSIDLPNPSLEVPDVEYNYVRIGADSVFKFGDFRLSLGGAYRSVSSLGDSPGQVAHVDWFPNAEASGVEVGIGLGYSLSDQFSIVATSDYRRYGFNFHRKPEDQMNPQPVAGGPVPIAGGATDTYLGGWLGVVFRIPEKK